MNSIAQIAEKFKRNPKIGLFFDEPLSARTSFKIGGKAALLAEPSDVQSLAELLTAIKIKAAPHFVLGGGSNVLFSDSGYDGIIVSTKKLAGISLVEGAAENESIAQAQDCAAKNAGAKNGQKAIIRAAAGESVAALVSFAEREGLSGLEEFAGLPGTVGGAVYMNARCFDREMSDVAAKITWLESASQDDPNAQNGSQAQDGSAPPFPRADAGSFIVKSAVFYPSDWAYKKSPFTGTGRVVLSAQFIVQKGDKASIAQKAAAFIQERKNKGHYKAPCAGSVFKNNRAFGRPTGKIIDELGLKGERRGGAQIAPFHGNIIINAGGASSADVRALIDLCKSAALEKFGFKLEEEIVVV